MERSAEVETLDGNAEAMNFFFEVARPERETISVSAERQNQSHHKLRSLYTTAIFFGTWHVTSRHQ
jgi:hypothetical protein